MVADVEPPGAPVVTVIVATYNQSASLQLALQSILDQDYPDFEVWVVGDGCTDDSAAAVASLSDARLQWINLGHNAGSQFAPNNAGLQRARGRYIAYLGHDDLWLPWHLSVLVDCIEATGADFVHALGASIGPSGPAWVIGPPADGTSYGNAFMPPCSWLHRREIIDTVGLWRDPHRLPWPTDFDFHRRAFLAGKSFAFSARLGVLKFPAGAFRLYAAAGQMPQRPYVQRLKDAPEALERQILADTALALARHLSWWEWQLPLKMGTKMFLRALLRYVSREDHPLRIPEVPVRLLLDAVGLPHLWPLAVDRQAGSNRWLMPAYLRWHYRRSFRDNRRERGLPT